MIDRRAPAPAAVYWPTGSAAGADGDRMTLRLSPMVSLGASAAGPNVLRSLLIRADRVIE
jgi:hypothetical protein